MNLCLDWKLKRDGKKNLCLPFAGYSHFHFGFTVHLLLVKDVFGARGISIVTESTKKDIKLLNLERLQIWWLVVKYSLLPVGIEQMMSYLK